MPRGVKNEEEPRNSGFIDDLSAPRDPFSPNSLTLEEDTVNEPPVCP